MSAAAGEKGSTPTDQPGSRTSSPAENTTDNNNNASTDNPSEDTANSASKNEGSQASQAESKEGKENNTDIDGSRPSDAATSDYFSHFSLEPNPFEQSFGNPAAETPGKSLLPPVASITSPALPGASSAPGFSWTNSLRAGPLSPAMLAGPAGSNEYFDSIGRGFPTPNESSLRTGLTPGGGGSMFPAPSPSAQAAFPNLQSGGATPSTLEFQRTALNVARKNAAATSNPQEKEQILQQSNLDIPKSAPQMDPFAHPDADAANGLFMLAKGAQASNNGQFVGPTSNPMPSQAAQKDPSKSNASLEDNGLGEMQNGESQDVQMNGNLSDPADTKPNIRNNSTSNNNNSNSNSKKKGSSKNAGTSNGRRKAEDTSKGSNKKLKGSNGASASPNDEDFDDQVGDDAPRVAGGNKNLTDEEKRKNFLERNRVAALKCRQRKKQWLNNLQTKVEMYSTENDQLGQTVSELRREIVQLKSIILAHKDCPISQSQGIPAAAANMSVNGMGGDYGVGIPPGPYTMPMQANPSMTAGGMPQR